jgi:hypothetical protein
MLVARFLRAMDQDLFETPDPDQIKSELMMPEGAILMAPLIAAVLLLVAILEMPHIKTFEHSTPAAMAACCGGQVSKAERASGPISPFAVMQAVGSKRID